MSVKEYFERQIMRLCGARPAERREKEPAGGQAVYDTDRLLCELDSLEGLNVRERAYYGRGIKINGTSISAVKEV